MQSTPSKVLLKAGVIVCDVSYRYLDEAQWIDGGERAIQLELVEALCGEIPEIGNGFTDISKATNRETHYKRVR